MSKTVNNKKILKNSISLYFRLIIIMTLTLYSSRLLLKYLGVDDYGLYHVVGGIVALCSFLSSSMTNATQRFISFEMGKGKDGNINRIFSICLITHLMMAFAILIIGETIGLYFVNSYLVIPEDRLFAANFIYQTSIIILIINVISIPYMSIFVSHEEMGIYASVGIIESLLKLIVAYLLCISPIDSLIFYGILLVFVSFLSFLFYFVICKYKHKDIAFLIIWDSNVFKSVFSFSGWNLFGQFSIIAANQGTNILVNMFHSLSANAAMGIGGQVNGAMQSLASNIQMAYKPQIVKTFSSGDYTNLFRLIQQATKFAFIVIFIAAVPIIVNIDAVLYIWLGNVPQYSSEFCTLFILASIFNTIGAAFGNSVDATGNIKKYQLVTSLMFLSDVIIVYLFFVLGYPPVSCMMVKAGLNFCVIFMRIHFAKIYIPEFPLREIYINVLMPIFSVLFFVVILFFV